MFVSTHSCSFNLEFQFDIYVKLVTVVMLFTQGYWVNVSEYVFIKIAYVHWFHRESVQLMVCVWR